MNAITRETLAESGNCTEYQAKALLTSIWCPPQCFLPIYNRLRTILVGLGPEWRAVLVAAVSYLFSPDPNNGRSCQLC
jgi:hypothetical protein